MIIPSYLGRGGSHLLPPQDIPPPLPLHTQWLKTYALEHPLPTYTMAKNVGLLGVCRGSAGGEGVGASGRGSAGLPAQMCGLCGRQHQQVTYISPQPAQATTA